MKTKKSFSHSSTVEEYCLIYCSFHIKSFLCKSSKHFTLVLLASYCCYQLICTCRVQRGIEDRKTKIAFLKGEVEVF